MSQQYIFSLIPTTVFTCYPGPIPPPPILVRVNCRLHSMGTFLCEIDSIPPSHVYFFIFMANLFKIMLQIV